LKFAERPLQLEVEVLKNFVSQSGLWYFVRQTICAYVELMKLYITWDIWFLRFKTAKNRKSSTSTWSEAYQNYVQDTQMNDT